jgi:hypothetical protein
MASFGFVFDTNCSGLGPQFGLSVFCAALDEAEEVVKGPKLQGGHMREFFDPTMMMTEIVQLPQPKKLSKAEKNKQRLLDIIYDKQTERMENQKQKNYYCSLSDFSHCYKLLTREDCEKKNAVLCRPFYFSSCFLCCQMAPSHLAMSFID